MIWSERGSQDCLNQKCHNWTPEVTPDDNLTTSIDKTIETVRKNHTLVSWRRAFLIGLILGIPICWWIQKSFPSGYTFAVVVGILFVGTYFAYTWIEYSRFARNDLYIEKELLALRSKTY